MSNIFITASPKKHHFWSNSTYAAMLTRLSCGNSLVLRLQGKKDYSKIQKACEEADSIILAMPLFVDSIPAHVLNFLQAMEEPAKHWHAKLYVISCCGFYEGHQTHLQLEQVQCWCRKTGVTYGGGLGIGATEMLGAIRFTNLFACIPMGLFVGTITGICSRNIHTALISGIITFAVSLALFLLWTSGLFIHTWRFGKAIKKQKTVQNGFTTVWFCGRPLFTFFASLFWIIRAAKNHISFQEMWKHDSKH